MQHTNVIIIGGGLAGLHTANRLKALNIPCILLEAKDHLGGRIDSVSASNIEQEPSEFASQFDHSHDMGPTWIFPHQYKIQALVKELGLKLFEQYAAGDVLFQAPNAAQPRQIAGAGAMQLFRLSGGMYQLVNSTSKELDNPESQCQIKLDHCVSNIRRDKTTGTWTIYGHHQTQNSVESQSSPYKYQAELSRFNYSAQHLVLALPPRVIERDLASRTWGSPLLNQRLTEVQTWMAAQAKFVATYPYPFWRDKGLSGQAFSQVGPMIEMHDASAGENSSYGLFGFIGIPPGQRNQLSANQLKQACLDQLAFFYGEDAYNVTDCYVKDWAIDPFCTTEQDINEPSKHPKFNHHGLEDELTALGLYLAGSEFAEQDAGYLEGALHSADKAVSAIHDGIIHDKPVSYTHLRAHET